MLNLHLPTETWHPPLSHKMVGRSTAFPRSQQSNRFPRHGQPGISSTCRGRLVSFAPAFAVEEIMVYQTEVGGANGYPSHFCLVHAARPRDAYSGQVTTAW